MKRVKCTIIIAMIMLGLIPAFSVYAQMPYEYYWAMDRPKVSISFNSTDFNVEPPERVEECNTDEYASIGLGVEICDYNEQRSAPPYGVRDGVTLHPVVTANTRKGIQYYPVYYNYLTDWYDPLALTDTGITDDDAGALINIPFYVRFYGGPGAQDTSFTYNQVWVSSNGFLCFGSSSNSPNPQGLPDLDEPNGLIAVYWTDLLPTGGKITYWNQSSDIFVVAWWNVLNKHNGQTETFEVVIDNERVPGYPAWYAVARGQNRIKLLYQDVSDYAVKGIENQEGSIGTLVSGSLNGKSVWLAPTSPSPEIRELSIFASKEDSNAEIMLTHVTPRGHNIDWLREEEDESGIYERAFMGFLTLLMTTGAGFLYGPLGGISVKILLLTTELACVAAKASWPANYLNHEDALGGQSTAYIQASAAYNDAYPGGDGHWPVDAWLATTMDWIFNDTDGLSHSIDIWGRLVYYVDGVGDRIIETPPVTIEMTPDIGKTFTTAKNVVPGTYYGCLDGGDGGDMYSLSVPINNVINVSMTPPGHANYDLYLYDPSHDCKISKTNSGNSTESIVYLAKTGGTWYINVTWTFWPGVPLSAGVYKFTVDEPYAAPRLTVLTKNLSGAYIDDVWVWIMPGPDGYWYKSQVVDMPVLPGSYSIAIESNFQRGHYNYTFDHWNDGGTSCSRGEIIDTNITLTAYYQQQFFNSPPNIPSTPLGETNGYAGTSYSYSTNTSDTNGDTVRYEFDWGDSTPHDITGFHPSGENVTAQHHWSAPGTYYVQVRAQDCSPYETWSNWSSNLQVTISNGGGGEGCPMLFVWNGTDYAYEGLLNIHNVEGIDMLTNHTLLTTPQRVGCTYLFNLIEHPQTHSYIDQVKLYAVLENGMVIQLPLIWAWHSEYGNVLPQLLFSDDWRTETIGAIHNNGTSQTITLRFLALPPFLRVTAYIFQIEGYNPEFKP